LSEVTCPFFIMNQQQKKLMMMMMTIIIPTPLWAHLTASQVDHLVTATFGTLSQHTHKAHLNPPSSPFFFTLWPTLLSLQDLFTSIKRKESIIHPPPPQHRPHLELRIGNPCPASGPIEYRHCTHRFVPHRLPMSTSPIRYRHFTLFWKLHADSLLGAGGGGWGAGWGWFFRFFFTWKKIWFQQIQRIFNFFIMSPNSLDFNYFV
jgi:hypothetical protein